MFKILVVMTDIDLEDLHSLLFEAEGHEVITIPYTHRSYEAIFAVACAEQPDLIVTQSQLNTMDGYELCKLLKIDPRTERIPIVVHVNYNEADDFRLLIKNILYAPSDADEILSVVNHVLAEK